METVNLFTENFFPSNDTNTPFRPYLNDLFFKPRKDNEDFPIHGPNVVRMTLALLNNRLDTETGLLTGPTEERNRTRNFYLKHYIPVREALEIDDAGPDSLDKVTYFLSVAALFHDIGKFIRRANHPQIGFNLLRNFDEAESNNLVNALRFRRETIEQQSKHNRFSLVCSITQHHDKFGVASTGEGALPIFSDILYFTSDFSMMRGIKKNVTSVMMLNLADVAAVCTAPATNKTRALDLAHGIHQCRVSGETKSEPEALKELCQIISNESSCLGLSYRKMHAVLSDWKILIDTIDNPTVRGNRGRLKSALFEIEKNPARTIERILRLLYEATLTTGAGAVTKLMDPTRVESVLVGALGSKEFQTFCERFATVVKLDYGLGFFKAIVCACVRQAITPAASSSWGQLTAEESNQLTKLDTKDLQNLASHITALFIKVLNGLVARYSEVLNSSGSDPRRFAFQLRDLTSDDKIRTTIIDLLCVKKNMDHVALTWIADEVTIWSLD